MTASHFLLDFLRERKLLPGFVDGYSRIAADEQRHIAYGTEFLQRAVAEDPAMAEVVRKRSSTSLPRSPSRWPRPATARWRTSSAPIPTGCASSRSARSSGG